MIWNCIPFSWTSDRPDWLTAGTFLLQNSSISFYRSPSGTICISSSANIGHKCLCYNYIFYTKLTYFIFIFLKQWWNCLGISAYPIYLFHFNFLNLNCIVLTFIIIILMIFFSCSPLHAKDRWNIVTLKIYVKEHAYQPAHYYTIDIKNYIYMCI